MEGSVGISHSFDHSRARLHEVGLNLFKLFVVQMVGADCSATVARAIHDGQTRRLVLVQLTPDIFKGFILAAACGCGTHDFFDPNFRCPTVISGHLVAQVALGNDADHFTAFLISNHRRATTSSLAHGY